jgi:hypothetical protein
MLNLVVHVITAGFETFNPLNAELNPICHLLALLGAHHILHVSRVRVKPTIEVFYHMVCTFKYKYKCTGKSATNYVSKDIPSTSTELKGSFNNEVWIELH